MSKELSQVSKIALLVWGPVVAMLVIYGSVYGIRYHKAKSSENKYNNGFQECMREYNAGKTNGYGCGEDQTDIKHGFFWLPEFTANGYPSNGSY